jgi:hypothetical protein
MAPNLPEITTTTLRNRKMTKRKVPVTPTPKEEPVAAKKKGITTPQFKKAFKEYEHSPEDVKEDKKAAHQMHITIARYEMTPDDRRKDIRGSINTAIKQIKRKGK